MNNEQTPALRQAVESMATMREAYDNLSQAAEAYNVGKTQLAAAITSKGVETSPTETYPEMAEKVNAISQETYEITGGELYGAQISGSLQAPNYWDLYAVLMQLLSDGRLVQYGGILLAEYYRGYDSLALSGAGSGGAYVVSDKDENGDFIKYDTDIVHTWNTEFDGYGNRWVAYCFAEEYHNFDITDTNTSPRSIFIGRKVGIITSLVNGRVSQIVVPDGNKLGSFVSGGYTQNFGRSIILTNVENVNGNLIYNAGSAVETIYIGADNISGILIDKTVAFKNMILKADRITGPIMRDQLGYAVEFLMLDAPYININLCRTRPLDAPDASFNYLKEIYICSEECTYKMDYWERTSYLERLNLYYITNDKTKSFIFNGVVNRSYFKTVNDVVLQNEWNKPISINYCLALTEANIYSHILQRLKQDEPDCGDGVTITLGSTNLAKLTSEESVQLLDDLTNIYGYTFA